MLLGLGLRSSLSLYTSSFNAGLRGRYVSCEAAHSTIPEKKSGHRDITKISSRAVVRGEQRGGADDTYGDV
jgi:hypothetical protein